LNENGFPRKYAKVTFHYCNGTNNSCTNPLTPNEIKDADFIFNGFYATTPANGQKYINSEGDMLPAGNNAAAAITTDTRWYADWNGYGTLEASRWPNASAYAPNGYAFVGWYTAANCGGTQVTSSYQFTTPDTDLYACWSQNVFTVTYDCGTGNGGTQSDTQSHPTTGSAYTVLPNGTANGGVVSCNLDGQGFAGWKFSQNTGINPYNAGDTITWLAGYGNETLTAQYRRCETNEVLVNGVCYPKCEDKTCTIPNSQYDNECPDHDPQYPNDGSMHCTYSDPAIVQGYYIDNEHTTCLYANGANQGSPINEGYCPETPVCNPGYTWSINPWGCIPDPNATYTIQFICEQNGTPITTPQTVHYGDPITVPSNSACTNNPGYSYSQWKATQYNNPATLPAQGTTYQYTWNQTHGETFIADWNNQGDIFKMTLNPNGGNPGSDFIGTLWERYNDGFYRNNDDGILSDLVEMFNATNYQHLRQIISMDIKRREDMIV
jgi:hypothetical protein